MMMLKTYARGAAYYNDQVQFDGTSKWHYFLFTAIFLVLVTLPLVIALHVCLCILYLL